MFTGLIAGQGEIVRIDASGQETRFGLRPLFPLCDVVIGESIAVNGACLTVETRTTASDGACSYFSVYASAETIRRTTLGKLRLGNLVNLERALAVGDRLGGHLVAGHVDCTATVADIKQAGESRIFQIKFDAALSDQIIQKGSVTLDGVSLTVNECGPGHLSVNVIPETQAVTTIGKWSVGTEINMETDIIGKYIQHMLKPYASSSKRITFDFLKENGF